jgi:hypothetical protein
VAVGTVGVGEPRWDGVRDRGAWIVLSPGDKRARAVRQRRPLSRPPAPG